MVKNPFANTKDESSIPGLGGFPGEWNGNPLQYSCLENSTDRGAHEVTKSMTEYQPSFLVVSTPHFHCWGPGFYPWFRNQNLTSLAAKKKQTNKQNTQLGGLPKIIYLKNGKARIWPRICSAIPTCHLLVHNFPPGKSEFKYSQKANFINKYLLG